MKKALISFLLVLAIVFSFALELEQKSSMKLQWWLRLLEFPGSVAWKKE